MALVVEETPEHITRSEQLGRLLAARGHVVERRALRPSEVAAAERARYSPARRLARRLRGESNLPQAWEILGVPVRRWLADRSPDLVLARGALAALVALPEPSTPLVVDLDSVTSLHWANRWSIDPRDLEATHEQEAQVLGRASLISVPHADVGRLLREAFPAVEGLEPRLVECPDGLVPAAGPAVARDGAIVVPSPPSHGDDPLLQAALLARIHRPVRRLGDAGPPRTFLPAQPPLLADGEPVSLGLVTRLSDRLSRLSCRAVVDLLELGVPVLAPRWLAVAPDLEPAVARFEELSFEADLASALERLDELRTAALALGPRRSWESAWEPLLARVAEC